jgi:hypothetical protein
MMIRAAGHTFLQTFSGLRCECGRRWNDIRCVVESDIGKQDIAHIGSLTLYEFREILEEREREDDVIWTAIRDAARAGAR